MKGKRTSWQWQLVLIMMLVSGLALGSFISLSWQIVRISNLNKLDAELVAQSLKDGWPFMVSLATDREHPIFPPSGPVVSSDSSRRFAFCNIQSAFVHTDISWPGKLDPLALAKTVPSLYGRQGKQMADSRLFELPGRTRKDRPQIPERRPRQPPRAQLPSLEQAVFFTVEADGQHWRLLGFSDGVGVLLLAEDLTGLKEGMANYRKAILISLPVALGLIGLVAWWFAGRAIRPVRRLTRSAAGITAKGLGNRLHHEGAPPEFAELIDVYNSMLDRLETSFLQATRFSADAAHELNTPLTILQGHLDLLLQAKDLAGENQNQVVTLIEEVHNLKEVVRKLLLLSQADSGRLPVEALDFNLSDLLEEVIEDASIIDPDIRFESEIDAEIHYKGDRDLLRQCIFNLVSNAIKYNRDNGYVKLVLRRCPNSLQLEVVNAGPAISDESQDRLFERFFRGDGARRSKAEGRGLGLSLAREFAKAHQGSLELIRNHADDIAFLLTLPLPEKADEDD